ncbi:hypothetical protein [Streptomyces sp. NBC_01506]|uniref:hypothetical protein n=1 Tax=Streptomyces sp. NBC_01506 TaxID=2903887 RepID=UPI00386EADCC
MSGFRRHCGYDSARKDCEQFTSIETILDAGRDDDSRRPVCWSSVDISLLGVRAQADGKTGLAALRVMRRDHPVLVHSLYTYLSVTAFLLTLIAATAITE